MSTRTFTASVLRWVDGDTVDLHVDLGFYVTTEQRFRLLGIDTPERGTPNYVEARQHAELLAPAGSTVSIETTKADKYGRFLARVTSPLGDSVNDALVEQGLAVPYFGGAKTT